MIKKIFVILLLFFSTTVLAETKPYPDKWEKFETFDDLQNVYWKIYTDTNNEDAQEVLERLKWHTDIFTEEETSLYEKMGVPNVSVEQDYNWFEQTKTSNDLQWYFNYEKELLRLENDIDLRNWTETIFVNDSLADSPFDLMEDLHAIETDLFGGKFEDQKFEAPLFIQYDEDQEELLGETEDWQDGRGSTLQESLGDREYGERDISLAGMLAGLKEPMDDLLSRPLIRSYHAEQWGEPSTVKPFSGDDYGAGISEYGPPPPDELGTLPESEIVLFEKPWDWQSGTAKQKLTDMSDLARYSNTNTGKRISDILAKTAGKELNDKELLELQLIDWENGMELQEKQRYNEIISKRLGFWNQDMEAMLEGFISVRRILEEFLKEKEQS